METIIKPILLQDIWTPEHDLDDYKVHFATKNRSGDEPLDAWIHGEELWRGWQEHRPERDMFRFPYIFSMMRVYSERQNDVWLFGGVFEVTGRPETSYQVRPMEEASLLVGRLKLRSRGRSKREIRVDFKNHYGRLEVAEVLPIEAIEDREAYWKIVLSG